MLILDGQENAYISADELTEELLAIPEEGAIWLDMSLFGSHDQVMTVARSFKLSPATQNILKIKNSSRVYSATATTEFSSAATCS